MLTREQIIIRIEEAMDTDARQKAIGKPVVRCFWPEVVHDYHEAYGYQESNLRLGPADKDKIPEWQEVMWVWLRWPAAHHRRVIMDRCRVYYNGRKAGQNWEWEVVRAKNKVKSLTTTKRIFDDGIEIIQKNLWRQYADGENRRYGMRGIRHIKAGAFGKEYRPEIFIPA